MRVQKIERSGNGEVSYVLLDMKLTRFWRVPKRGSLSHGGDGKRKNVRFSFTEDVT